MPSLLDLPCEVLERIFKKIQNLEDVISLGSASPHLAMIVGQVSFWRLLLDKTKRSLYGSVNEDEVRSLATFVSSRHRCISSVILSELHQMIYKRYPAIVQLDCEQNISVSFPGDPQPHSVSVLGLELLALTDREDIRLTVHEVKVADVPPSLLLELLTITGRQPVHKVKVGSIYPSLLLSLASIKLEHITELEVRNIYCTSEEEGSAMVSLLEKCTSWKVGMLKLFGGVGGHLVGAR